MSDTSSNYTPPGRLTRLAMHAVTLFFVLGNLAVIFHPPKLGLKGVKGLRDYLPGRGPYIVHELFLLPGMFSGYSTNNLDLIIKGRLADTSLPEEERWISLRRKEHLPRLLNTEYTRMWISHERGMLGKRAQKEGWKTMTAKIRDRHNRLHPDRPIDGVRLGVHSWPQQPGGGYRANKTVEQTKLHTWYEDPPVEPAQSKR